MAKIIFKNQADRCLYSADERSFLIGRGLQADFVLDEAGVSRAHAQVSCYGSFWFIVDQGSTNGSYINGYQLISGEIYPLRDGDIVKFGHFETNLEIESPSISSDPALSVFRGDVYQGEFFIGESTSFSLGGATATIPAKEFGTDDLIFLVRREADQLILSQKSREHTVKLNGQPTTGLATLSDRDQFSIGTLLVFVTIPLLRRDETEALNEHKGDEVPNFLKDRMGSDSWDDPLRRRKNTGTLLSIDKFISEEMNKGSHSSPELGVHRFSSAKLKIQEDIIKKEKSEFFMGVVSIVSTLFMGGILIYLYF